MRKSKQKETSREGRGSSPPRFASEAVAVAPAPHQIELDVQRALLAHPGLRFASLVVRRIDNGVCLQGVVDADSPDVCHIAQRISGVRQVLNHLLVAPGRGLPP